MAIPLLAGGIAFSGVQKVEAQSGPQLRLARFWVASAGQTLLEGAVGLPFPQATRTVNVAVRDSTGKVLYNETWVDSAKAGAAAASGAQVATPLELLLKPGMYTVAVSTDEGGRRDSAISTVHAFSSAPPVSDVLVGGQLRMLATGDSGHSYEVVRGHYAITRGAQVTILPSDPRLWYYLEVYRQGNDSVAELEFKLKRPGSDAALVAAKRSIAVAGGGTVDAAAFPVQGLPPGEYVLSVEAESGGHSEKRLAPFTMGSFDTAPVAAAPTGAATSGVSESALFDRYFSPAVASDAEIARVVDAMTVGTPGPMVPQDNTQLTTDAKRRFLAKYWAAIPDPNPATPLHEMVDEYMARVRYVEKNFAERGRPGVKTDRGRIYLRYGPPDASQHFDIPGSNGSGKVADVWKYTRHKALKYVFLDETGFQNFGLVFTTDPNERGVGDWQDRIHDVETLRQISNF